MAYLPNILFALALITGIGFFSRNVRKLLRNIRLGRDERPQGPKSERLRNMALIAIGQRKMVVRPIAVIVARLTMLEPEIVLSLKVALMGR